MPRLTSAKLSQLAIHKDGQKGSICGWGKNPAVVDQRAPTNALDGGPSYQLLLTRVHIATRFHLALFTN
jgi:hypothetical protein